MRCFALLPMLCVVACATPCLAQATPTTSPSDEIRLLIASLSADDEKARLDAQHKLAIIGKPAAKALEDLASTISDPEALERAHAILGLIDLADAGAWPPPATRATLHFDNAPA